MGNNNQKQKWLETQVAKERPKFINKW